MGRRTPPPSSISFSGHRGGGSDGFLLWGALPRFLGRTWKEVPSALTEGSQPLTLSPPHGLQGGKGLAMETCELLSFSCPSSSGVFVSSGNGQELKYKLNFMMNQTSSLDHKL